MNAQQFEATLSSGEPPETIKPLMKALWFDAKGDWHRAHRVVQELSGEDAAWVHAYLHRKEGDLWNADYWYRRAGRTRPSNSLDDEWRDLVDGLL